MRELSAASHGAADRERLGRRARAVPVFEDFYDAEFPAVAGLAHALSGSSLGSEDLAQEAFLAAYRRWEEIGCYDNPGAWVRRAVANRAVSAFRTKAAERRAVRRLAAVRQPVPELTPEAADVWRAVRRLPKRQAQAIALFYLEDLTVVEVAEVLGRSAETVRTHLRRARKALAARLADQEDDHAR